MTTTYSLTRPSSVAFFFYCCSLFEIFFDLTMFFFFFFSIIARIFVQGLQLFLAHFPLLLCVSRFLHVFVTCLLLPVHLAMVR